MRPPFLAMPFPLDEYLDALPADYGKVTRRLLRAANWQRGSSRCGRFELDPGEALMDQRSEELWGGLRFEKYARVEGGRLVHHELSAEGRKALVRRVLDRLERDGIIERRSAQAGGPTSAPRNSPRNGPTPTIVRFVKFREILWPASTETAQETARGSAQESAPANGPILPASPPAPPTTAAARAPLGPLGTEYRRRVEQELGHGLAFGGALATRDELEGLLAQDWVDVDQAVKWTLATARSRRRPGTEPGSVEWCVKLLRDLRAPEREPGPDAAWLEGLGPRRAEAEEQWARVVERVHRVVWPDRRDQVLADELQGLVDRFGARLEAHGDAA